MVLATIADIIYKFYCFLHGLVTLICYIGYLVHYIICKAIWIVQNIAVFTQIVYEDNHHLIKDTNALIVGISDFFIANIGKVCSGISFVGTALLEGTVAVGSLVKLIATSSVRSLTVIGDAVWMLVTAPYHCLVFIDWFLGIIPQKCKMFLTDVLHYVIHDMKWQSTCGLLLLVFIILYPSPIRLLINFFRRKLHAGVEYLHPVFRTILLHIKMKRTALPARVEMVPEEMANRSTVGICIICQENERTVAFVPCGHLCVCKGCASSLILYSTRCPLCRSYIDQKLEVYI